MQSQTAVSPFGTNFQKAMHNQQPPLLPLGNAPVLWIQRGIFVFLAERAAGVCCVPSCQQSSCSALWLQEGTVASGVPPSQGSWWGQTIKVLSPSGDEDRQLVGDESKVADEKIHPDNCCNYTLRMQLLSQSIGQALLLNLYLAVNFILCLKSKEVPSPDINGESHFDFLFCPQSNHVFSCWQVNRKYLHSETGK